MSVDIWYTMVNPTIMSGSLKKYLSMLTSPLQKRVLGLKRKKPQTSRLLSYLLLQQALQEKGLESLLNDIKYTVHNRPYFAGQPVDFNVSHSDNCVVCAVTQVGRIGADVEYIKDRRWQALRPYFTATEWKKISSSDHLQTQFYKLWTQKEAIAKADGRGFSLSLRNICVGDNQGQLGSTCWYLKEIDLIENYVLHVASDVLVEDYSVSYVNFTPTNYIK